MAKPKLCLIPSAVGDGALYSVLPSTGVGDFDFSRSNCCATRVNAQGLIETVDANTPRLNYPLIDGEVSGCPSLLLEPERRNLVQYSEDFSNSYWTKTGSSITSNVAISPDGSLNADKLVEGTTTGEKFTQTITSVSNTTIYTASVFVKFAGREWIRLTDAQSSNRIHFNTKTGVFGSATGTVISYESTLLGDGWYKLSLTTTSVATAYAMRIVLAENDNDVSYTGDGTSGVYIYGAMLEEGSYPTSYIPNYGTAAGVTRSAETANGSGDADTFNDSEGVLMAEISANSSDVAISLSDNTFNNSISFGVYLNKISAVIRKDGGYITSGIIDNSTNAFNNNKIAIKYNFSSCDFYVNGFVIGSSSGVTYNSNVLDNLNFNRGSANDNFYGNTKQIQYYNTALTDAELEKLTSYDSFRDMAIAGQYKTY